MRFLRQSLTGLFLTAITVGLLLFAANMIRGAIEQRLANENGRPTSRERVFAVNVIQAVSETIAPELIAFGQIQSRRSLEVRAKASGSVVHLAENFLDGGNVTAGQVLLQVDPARAEYALERVSNDIQDAQAESRDATRTLELAHDELKAASDQVALRQKALARQLDLQKREVGTTAAVEVAELAVAAAQQAELSRRQSLTQAQARIEQAATRIERARIAQDEAKRNLADTTLHATFTGTLSDVAVVQGGLVSLNERLATLIDGDALEVVFRVSTSQYARLLDEQGGLMSSEVRATLEVLGLDLSSTGVITRDGAAVGEGQTGRRIFARLDQTRGLKPGDFVTVRVQEKSLENVVRLPASALDATNRVLLVTEDDRLESLTVDLLRRQDDMVLVRGAGLVGRKVVTRRTPLLGAGIQVKPLEASGETVLPENDLVALSAERRAELIAFVNSRSGLPEEIKQNILEKLGQEQVPAKLVDRLQSRMGG